MRRGGSGRGCGVGFAGGEGDVVEPGLVAEVEDAEHVAVFGAGVGAEDDGLFAVELGDFVELVFEVGVADDVAVAAVCWLRNFTVGRVVSLDQREREGAAASRVACCWARA